MLDYWLHFIQPRVYAANLKPAQLVLFAVCCLRRAWERLSVLNRLPPGPQLVQLVEEANESLKQYVNGGTKPRPGLAEAVSGSYPDPDDPDSPLFVSVLIHALNCL